MTDKINILFFPPVRYEFVYQRPQALADKLSERPGCSVYFFDQPSSRYSLNNGSLGFSFLHAVTELNPNLRIVKTPRCFTFMGLRFKLAKKRMISYSRKWVKRFIQSLFAGQRTVAYFQTPLWKPYVEGLSFSAVLYDCIDDPDVIGPKEDRQWYDRTLSGLLNESLKVFATAKQLESSLSKRVTREKILRLPNGVLLERFDDPEIPAEIMQARRKYKGVVGYVGVLFHWIDMALLEVVAEATPDLFFMFVGPYRDELVGGLKRLSNVALAGPVEHKAIPGYIAGFDVCLNPFKINKISLSTNPIKLYEYLALGKPVVSTPIKELGEFDGLIYSEKDAAGFIARIRSLVGKSESKETIEKRKLFAAGNSWDQRAATILQVLRSAFPDLGQGNQ